MKELEDKSILKKKNGDSFEEPKGNYSAVQVVNKAPTHEIALKYQIHKRLKTMPNGYLVLRNSSKLNI